MVIQLLAFPVQQRDRQVTVDHFEQVAQHAVASIEFSTFQKIMVGQIVGLGTPAPFEREQRRMRRGRAAKVKRPQTLFMGALDHDPEHFMVGIQRQEMAVKGECYFWCSHISPQTSPVLLTTVHVYSGQSSLDSPRSHLIAARALQVQ